ncbi:autotransporter outer membrane beta-barrel domain-containing protein [Bordetella bronchiseptica]|uniref:autotransporter outer membrane beta-barrel domain-containing protein n=1 Tax=Bordetella bronchiseptica TaxID=518 RepID=UPI0004617955|nr:autotransporter outer membrane beta-barrel domain-containing protein [Bordetella bronchiseptica]KDD42461.1 outer membrane autotransporter barrel domain protein [Bordetella bronchiseptica MBORD901]
MQRRNQSFKRNIGQPGMRGHGVAPTVLVLALGFHGTAAWADCQTAGSAVTCDASSPNPYTGTVGSGASSGGLTITVGPDARIESGNAHAISVGTGNSISLDGNAQVSNSATTGGPGNYSTIEFEHSNTLTIGADARVAAEGTDPTAHAIALTGRSNTITNYGTVSSASGAAIWNQFEGIYVNNTVYNYGVIETAANGGDAVVIGSVTGNNATDAGISLHNFAGARIVGNVVLSDTDDSVRLEAGSTLTGSLDGGTGTDTLYLAGTTGSSELSRDVSNFNEISKIDSGSTWTLSGSLGANSSGKVTVVNAYNGELIVTGDNRAAAAGSAMTVWAGARLQVNTTSAMAAIESNGSGVAAFSQQTDGTYAGVLSGGGNFAKEGAGSLTLTGVNTYTGALQLKEGKLIVSAAENLGAANSRLEFDGGTLNTTSDMTSARRATIDAGGGMFEVASGTTLNWTGLMLGNGTLVKEGAGTLALSGFNSHGGTVVNAGTVQISNDYGLGNGALTLNNSRLASTADIYTEAAATVNGNGTFDTANGTTLQWMGDIGGTGALVKTGAGTLLLGGDSLYAGGTVVNAGTVQVFKDASLGGGALTLNNASLASLDSFSTARAATLTGNATFDTAVGTTLGWTGDIGGAGALVKTGAGTLVLGGDNQYAGGTTVDAGAVQVSRDANLGAAAGAVTLNNARLASTGTFSTSRTATLTGNGTFDTATGTTLGWTGDIGGAGALVKTGQGTLVLGGANQYGGSTTVNAGTVQVARDANLGAAAGTVALNGGTLAASAGFTSARGVTIGAGNGAMSVASGASLDWQGLIGGTGALIKEGAGTLVLANDNQYAAGTVVNAGTVQVSRDANLGAAAGTVALNNARLASTGTFSTARAATLTGNGTFDTADGTTLDWAGDIGGAGALVKEGLGTLVLDGDNQYAGGTTVNAGTVQVARDANLGAAGGAVRLQGATLASTASFASARTLTLGAAGGTFATLGATTLGWDAAIDGAGGLTKTGAGDLVLSRANTYAGPTLIKEGRLAVNGSIASPVTIDPDGVLGGTGRILGAVANSGTVAPGNSIGTLTIVGNYAGTGGRLEMEAELGGDASPADRLVIDGGAATGSTSVAVINQGGLGGQTDQGIPLVVARNGATTTADAFSLASPVAAGAYEYKLLRGTPDGAAANAQNWYLRSGLLVPPAEVPGGGPGGAPEPEFIPFYRPEVALYAGAPMLMRAVGLQALGTYHERTGEQGLMTRDDPDPVRRGAWTRAFGRTFERSGSGDVDPRFDGHVAGLQAGVDLYARRSDKGHADLAGVFGGYANARGHMDGFARGETGAYAGKPDLNAYYIGGYWTHIGPSGWYVDAVLAGTRYEQKAKSSNDLRTEAKGWGVTASVEAGYPVPIGEKWHIEPQAQLVYQRLTVSNGEDDVSSVSYRTPDSVTARLGARLSGQYAYNTTQLRPFMEVSLLRDFAGTDTVTFSGIDRIDSRYQATAVDLKAGLVAQVRKDVGLWGQVGYGKSIGGGDGSDRGWAASLGLRIEY